MKRCKILIVDDIPTNVTLISTIIKKKLDAYSDTALSGEEALKKIDSFNPDIIILDLMMPGVDGWDVIRSVRSKHGKDEVAIIVTSAITDEVNMAECYDLGGERLHRKAYLAEQTARHDSPASGKNPGIAHHEGNNDTHKNGTAGPDRVRHGIVACQRRFRTRSQEDSRDNLV